MLLDYVKGYGLHLEGNHGIYVEAIDENFFFHGPSLVASFDSVDLTRIR